MDNTYSTTIYLAGIEFRVAVQEKSEEYMQKLAVDVNRRIEEMQSIYPTLSTSHCALLAMLKLTNDNYELKGAYESLECRIDSLRSSRAREPVPVKRPFEPVTTAAKPK